MFEPVWSRLVTTPCRRRSARLQDHARLGVRDESYPALVKQSGASVDGVLIEGLTTADLARLDAFEGEDYRRETVTVWSLVPATPPTGQTAFTYLYQRLDRVTGTAWDEHWFAQAGMAGFLTRYVGFQEP